MIVRLFELSQIIVRMADDGELLAVVTVHPGSRLFNGAVVVLVVVMVEVQ
jgi:hypothetical protein